METYRYPSIPLSLTVTHCNWLSLTFQAILNAVPNIPTRGMDLANQPKCTKLSEHIG